MRLHASLLILLVTASVSTAEAGGEACPELGGNPDAETLYNAGVCLEQSRSIGEALAAYQALLKRFPRDRLAKNALARAAVLYEGIAAFREAARLYLDYSRRYAAERDAPDALRQAIVLLDATGDRTAAMRAIDQFVKQYGRKRAGDAAEIFFAAAGIYERDGDEEELARHLERYLRDFGARGGRDRAAVAHATLGSILWKRSCPLGGGGAAGTCRRAVRRRSRAPRCDSSVIATRRVRRAPALVKKAREHLTRAVAIYRPPPRPTSPREHAAAFWRARAELLLLEQGFEAYIDDSFPRGLDFDPQKRELRRRSVERLTAWLERKEREAVALREKYQVLARGPAAGAASERAARLASHLRDELAGSEIPRDVRRGPYAAEIQKAYCDALEDVTRPLEAAAVAALEHCLGRPSSSPWRKRCAAELVRIDPEKHPPANEWHGSPAHVAPIVDTAGD